MIVLLLEIIVQLGLPREQGIQNVNAQTIVPVNQEIVRYVMLFAADWGMLITLQDMFKQGVTDKWSFMFD